MPGGIELDLVDPVAIPVVGAQDGKVALGSPAMLDRRQTPGDLPRLARAVEAPPAPFALKRFLQCDVDLEEVDRLKPGGVG